jgi:hypothetical protein
MLSRLWRRSLIVAPLAVSAVCAISPARASEIVYNCARNLCAINSDGTGQTQLTSDGSYSSPSLSRDGSQLAFVYRESAYVGAPSAPAHTTAVVTSAQASWLSPSGTNLLVIEGSLFFGQISLCALPAAGGTRSCAGAPEVISAAWEADEAHVLTPRRLPAPPYNMGLCERPLGGSTECTWRVNDPSHDLSDPAVSPDGTEIAVVSYPVEPDVLSHKGGHIAIYSFATGALIKELTAPPAGMEDASPVWSPDGTQIAFVRTGPSIFITQSTAAPGSEHMLTAGTEPTWGGAACDTLPGGTPCPSQQPSQNVSPGSQPPTQSASLETLLARQLSPRGRAAKISEILRHRGYALNLKAPEAGSAVVSWYQTPHGGGKHKRRSLIVASGKRAYKGAEERRIKLTLSRTGRTLLRHSKQVKLTAKIVFTPTHGATITATTTFTLT